VQNHLEKVWEDENQAKRFGFANSGALRVALLFGSAAVAFTLILTPFIDRSAGNVIASRGLAQQLDQTTTGSISTSASYTVRRSVLQSSPGAVCVIRESGSRSGEC
jgi:hypothetical protein